MEEALALDPDVSRAHNALGVIAFETGHPAEAITHWKRSVELNPREWDTLFNLGKVLRQQGRDAEARLYLEQLRSRGASLAVCRRHSSCPRLARSIGTLLRSATDRSKIMERFGLLDRGME